LHQAAIILRRKGRSQVVDLTQLREDLERDEGLILEPYKDTVGKLTIGIGRNLDDVGITAAEAHHLLENDIERVLHGLNHSIPWWVRLSEPRQRALANMAFNLGLAGLLKFKRMLRALKDGEYERAANEALDSKWANQVGRRADRIADLIRKG
jgi:lysozyme